MKKLLADWSKKREEIINKHKDIYNKLLFEKSKYKTREDWKIAKFNERQGNLNKNDNFNCPKCKNRGGFLYLTEDGYEQFKYCECSKFRDTINKLKRSGLNSSLKEKTFENFKTKATWQEIALQKAKNFVKETGKKWFYFGGQSGCGKTHLCTAISICFLNKNKNVHYMPWRDEVTRLKSVIFNESKYGSYISVLKNVEVLYIDDFWKTGKDLKKQMAIPPTSDINIAYEIINSRYATKKITIFSSEFLLREIFDIDEAIGSRIYEMSDNGGFCYNLKRNLEKNYRNIDFDSMEDEPVPDKERWGL